MYCKITLGNIEEHIVVKHFKMYLFGTYKYHNVIIMVIKLCCLHNGRLDVKEKEYSIKHST